MKVFIRTLLIVVAATAVTGCGSSSPSGDAVSVTPTAIDGSKYLLADEPDEAVGVIEARESAEDGAPIVVVGRIGGATNPWVEGRAAFTLIDASMVMVASGEDDAEGELCLEDCCAEDRAACTTLVKVLDDNGRVIAADSRQLLGLAEDDTVVIRGKANKDASGNFAVVAEGVFVRR
ncbi:MAG: hypothetical protein H0T51_08195 [Pirellulales bacterium]|nr:hypothetical protein [Pirellulales bacterium]